MNNSTVILFAFFLFLLVLRNLTLKYWKITEHLENQRKQIHETQKTNALLESLLQTLTEQSQKQMSHQEFSNTLLQDIIKKLPNENAK